MNQSPVHSHNNLDALLYFSSAESYALSIQTYRFAKSALLTNLKKDIYQSPAVVLDLDETVLDNGAYNAWLIQSGRNFHEESWSQWCNCTEAGLIPGAKDFIDFAVGVGVQIFFITSRQNSTRPATAKNLHDLGILTDKEFAINGPEEADPFQARLFMKGMEDVVLTEEQKKRHGVEEFPLKNKFQQRVFIEATRGLEIILSLGDNLGDYAEYYGKVYNTAGLPDLSARHPAVGSRQQSARQDRALFGTDFVLMPNSFYGGWLRAIHENLHGAPDEVISTNRKVRGELGEPQGTIKNDKGEEVATEGPKFSNIPKVWRGPTP